MTSLPEEIIAMARRDAEVRERLARTGELFDGYNAEMERVHVEHARRLAEILDEHGWPGGSMVGEEAAEAAWLVAQHAISMPDFQRRVLELIREAAERGEVARKRVAMLEDRSRVFEGKQQRFGTQFDWDEDGEMSPNPIADPETVDERRAEMGLEPLADAVRRMRQRVGGEGQRPPESYEARQREIDAWCREVGWRD